MIGGFGFSESLFFIGGGLMMAAFWVGVIYLGVRLARREDSGGRRSNGALDILEERYARGEITRDEYVERREVLRGRQN